MKKRKWKKKDALVELNEIFYRLQNKKGLHSDLVPEGTELWWDLWGCQDDGREGSYPKNACMFCLVRNAIRALGGEEKYERD